MSYDPTLPSARDRMRFTLGDIAEPPLRTDATYDALLEQFTEPIATMKMAESLASEFAQNPSSLSVGSLSVSYSTLVQTWREVASNIRASLGSSGTAIGTMTSGRVQRFEDTSDAEYRRGMDDLYSDDYRGPAW